MKHLSFGIARSVHRFRKESEAREKQPPEVFFKKSVLKNFAIFIGKHLFWSIFLVKLQALRSATLLIRYSNTGVFL